MPEWPLKWRRIFLLTLPVSGPALFVGYGLYLILLILTLVALYPIVAVINLWHPYPRGGRTPSP